jgi:hypothetical protein
MSFKPFSEFEKERIKEVLGKYGEAIQAPYYSFIQKILSKRIKTCDNLKETIQEYKNKGLKEGALKELIPLIRPDLWKKRKS